MRQIRTVVVDDEALARERLTSLLSEHEDVEVIGECTGVSAVAMIEELEPDLIFLDVQMPEVDGLDVVAQLDPDDAPIVVFATAFDEFAVRAFEAHALDYLLKPIGGRRLADSLQRARQQLQLRERGERTNEGIGAMLEGLAVPGAFRERIAVRTGSRFAIVRTSDILWIEAADNYARLHTGRDTHLLRTTMAELERALDPARFLRIHRSSIINVDAVVSIEPWGFGEYLCFLSDGTKVTSSRGYRGGIRAAFGC